MARTAMTAVENLGPFDLPTPTVGDEIYNSGDGVYFKEEPGQPATIGLYNASAGTLGFTVTAAPGAPGGAADFSSGAIISPGHVLVVPPGFFPAALYRRDDGQATNPGTIYLTASGAGLYACVVRGPAGYQSKRGAVGAASIGNSRTLWTYVQSLTPAGALASNSNTITDADGIGWPYSGDEAICAARDAGVFTLTITRNPNDPFGGSADTAITTALAAEMILLPPGVPHPSLVRREHATDNGFIYLSSNQAASTKLSVAKLARRRP